MKVFRTVLYCFIGIISLFFILLFCLKVEYKHQCYFNTNDTNNILVLTNEDKKFMKTENQRATLTYNNATYKIYIQTYDYNLNEYSFYTYNDVDFAYGTNSGVINFGYEQAWRVLF